MTSESQQVRAPALEMRGITKRYPGVVANQSIDLDIRPGEIHALLGENGAGKTTLMNILYGLARPDEGKILIDGTEVTLSGPSDAIRRGISMVHQHFMLVPVLSVAENIVLGEESTVRGGFLDRKEAHKRIVELGRRFGFEVDPEVKVGSLSVGWQLFVMCMVTVVLAGLTDAAWAVAAGLGRVWFMKPRHNALLGRLSGVVLIGGGLWLSLARRTS